MTTQEQRKAVLQLLANDYHRSKYGDYEDTYAEFAAVYGLKGYDDEPESDQLSLDTEEPEPIPRYAVITHDETYSMIHMYDTELEAYQGLGSQLGQDTLGTNGDIIDLDVTTIKEDPRHGTMIDSMGVMSYYNLVLPENVHSLICALLHHEPDQDVFADGGVWQMARDIFSREHMPPYIDMTEQDPTEAVYLIDSE